jgi:hypothetical protein
MAAALMFLMAVALLALAFGASVPALTVFVLLWSLGNAIAPPLEPLLLPRLFGRTHYASLYGVMDGAIVLTSIPGPWLGGFLFEHFGSYTPVLALYAVALAGGGASLSLVALRIRSWRWPQALLQPRQEDLAGLLDAGQRAARAGDRERAYQAFSRLVEEDPANEEAWLWLAATASSPDYARVCLLRVLALNPSHPRALDGLDELEQRRVAAQMTTRAAVSREASPSGSALPLEPVQGALRSFFGRVPDGQDVAEVYGYIADLAARIYQLEARANPSGGQAPGADRSDAPRPADLPEQRHFEAPHLPAPANRRRERRVHLAGPVASLAAANASLGGPWSPTSGDRANSSGARAQPGTS